MFQIDIMSRKPIYEQVVEQVEKFVLTGILKEEDRLPSVRSLSMELSINPNTIQKGYTELEHRGVICTIPGKGCFIKADIKKFIAEKKAAKVEQLRVILEELKAMGADEEELKRLLNE